MSQDKRVASGDEKRAEEKADDMSMDQEKAAVSTAASARFASSALDGESAEAIARQLKTTYGKLLDEPVPDKFLQLLDALGSADDAAQTDERGKKSSQNKG